ncbi:50S ribosomal protein L10 [Blattabacterium cuenoti]|uniref:50S ribosomal protein L10 n=1 Tax=Blattabacterium cuenoti TaxID=1653831 RepID=UPI00163BE4A3|nr:50S ribosomal protein L10 [Blattabacterium cuenoti]
MKINRKQKNCKELSELTSILSNNESVYLINISNLDSNQISFLRKNFYKNNIRMKVVKNSLLKISIRKNKKLNSFIPFLNGNSSIVFSNKGKIISQIIKKFHNQEKIERPILKAAYFQELFYFGNKGLDLIINFKSKEDLIIDILLILQYPIKEIIFSFSQEFNNIFNILNYISNNHIKKSINK